jgi:putative phage-type endonuclease
MLSEAQLQIRSKGVGGSESPALLGLDPYRNAQDVWERKLGLAPSRPDTHHTERGNFLEAGFREWASKRLGARFEPAETFVHPEHPHVLATPDGIWRDDHGRIVEVMEIKSPGPRTLHEWGDGDDEAPLRYVVQVAQEMLVTGARRGRIVAYMDGDIRIYTIHRDTDLERVLVENINDFWARYVETKTPPPVDGTKAASEWLARRFPNATKEWKPATPSISEVVAKLAEVDRYYTQIETTRELLVQQVKEFLGEAHGVEVPGVGKATWGAVKGRTTVDWEAMAKHLGATEQHEAQFLKTGKGHRSFRFYQAKEAK